MYASNLSRVEVNAPLRVSFAGGGTDVDPFRTVHGGMVVSCAIDLYVTSVITKTVSDKVKIISLDTNQEYYATPDEPEDQLANNLLRACLISIPAKFRRGMEIHVHSPVKTSSGLGASSAIIVSMIVALRTFIGISCEKKEIAEIAINIERELLRIPGGIQDQYASVYGGFNKIIFPNSGNPVQVKALDHSGNFASLLNSNSFLAWTGITRQSHLVLEDQIEKSKKTENEFALMQQRELVDLIEINIDSLSFPGFASTINEAWRIKKDFSQLISNPVIDKIHSVLMANGAKACKLLGAGGGGYMLVLCNTDNRSELESLLSKEKIQTTRVSFDGNYLKISHE